MTRAEQTVVLQLPADPTLLRVARVTTASVAAELPFTLQDVEDLRIAVDELTAVLIDGCGPEVVVTLEIRLAGEAVEVAGTAAGAGPPPSLHPVALDLLDLVAPGYQVGGHGDTRTFHFTKAAAVPAT